MLPPGQAAIRFRLAWLAGDLAEMRARLPELDEAHRVELVLGAALRDGREAFAAARRLGAGEAEEAVLPALLGEPDTRADEAASAWIAAGRVDARWRPEGGPAGPVRSVEELIAQYAAGVGGLALVEALRDRPLHGAVSAYYRRSRLVVLGPRPMIVLASLR